MYCIFIYYKLSISNSKFQIKNFYQNLYNKKNASIRSQPSRTSAQQNRPDRVSRAHSATDRRRVNITQRSPFTRWQVRTTWVCGWSMATSKPKVCSSTFSLNTRSCAWNLLRVLFFFWKILYTKSIKKI